MSSSRLLLKILPILLAVLYTTSPSQANTVTYDFNLTWVTANPDGLADRTVVGINGQWPLPVIEVNKGDRLIVNMHNGLDRGASIHFHGMYQNGTNDMDGANMVTQCPIPAGNDFTYDFVVNQNGTYWYHCHTEFCYPDGYRQALIVHDDAAYFDGEYDEEFTITLSDWYHEMTQDIAPSFLSLYNPAGAEPIPDSFLFNDTMNTKLSVKPNTTYLLRLINIGAFVAQYFYIEDHTFRIVEIDGVYVDPAEADTLYIAIAQRYSVLVTTKNTTDQNYPIVTVADSNLLDTIPPNLQLNNTNWLEYNETATFPQATIQVSQASDLVPFDDINLVSHDRMELLTDPDLQLTLTVQMGLLVNGLPYAFLDNLTYTAPKVPSLYTALSSGNLTSNVAVYGENTHPVVLERNQVVEIVLNNDDGGTHPFHLHGHNFQLVDRAPGYGADFYSYLDGDPVPYDPTSNQSAFPRYPARRDTFILPPQGYLVIRFVADNPGVWMFHCHIDWHLAQGLAMLFVEAPSDLQAQLTVPKDHYQACTDGGIPYQGNAAGNTANFLDLSGENTQAGNLPAGFTTGGIVALVFSCISGVLGMIFIAIYGMSDMKFAGVGKSVEATLDGANPNPGSGNQIESDHVASGAKQTITTTTTTTTATTGYRDEAETNAVARNSRSSMEISET